MELQFFNKELKGKWLFMQKLACKDDSIQL